MPLGYDKNGAIIESEAAVVKYVFEKSIEYRRNPPSDMVEAKIESARVDGEELSYEDAVKRITSFEIECTIWNEIKANPDFVTAILEYNKRSGSIDSDPNMISGKLNTESKHASKPIISRDVWNKVQDSRKIKSAVLYTRESNHPGAEESLEKQQERLKTLCQRKGYVIADEVSTIGSRQDSLFALKQAIERAKETEDKILLISASNRVVGTPEEVAEIAKLIDESGVIMLTEKEGSYERVELYSESLEMQIANTIAASNDELNDDIDEDEGMGITFG